MLTKGLALLFTAGLMAQVPTIQPIPESQLNLSGEVWKIAERPAVPAYEYDIFDGDEDLYTGPSAKPLNLRLHAKVKFAVRGTSMYVLDADGKVQGLLLVKQAEIQRVTVPN